LKPGNVKVVVRRLGRVFSLRTDISDAHFFLRAGLMKRILFALLALLV